MFSKPRSECPGPVVPAQCAVLLLQGERPGQDAPLPQGGSPPGQPHLPGLLQQRPLPLQGEGAPTGNVGHTHTRVRRTHAHKYTDRHAHAHVRRTHKRTHTQTNIRTDTHAHVRPTQHTQTYGHTHTHTYVGRTRTHKHTDRHARTHAYGRTDAIFCNASVKYMLISISVLA